MLKMDTGKSLLMVNPDEDLPPETELQALETYRDSLQEEILSTQNDISLAKAKQKLTGEYVNAEMFAQWRNDVHRSTVELHEVNRKIRALRKSIHENRGDSLEEFRRAAHEILSPKLYKEIDELAKQRFERSRNTRKNSK